MHAHFNIFLTMFFWLALQVSIPWVAWSAPTPVSPDLPSVEASSAPADNGTEGPSSEEIERANLVNVSNAEPVRRTDVQNDYFYRYRNSISVRSGAEVWLQDLKNPGPLLGVLYWFPLKELGSLEVGTDLARDGFGTIHAGLRSIVGFERFRWFYKWGFGIRVVASDQLVTFVRPRNWQLRAGGGLEVTLADPISLRFDLGAIYGFERSSVDATVGLSFAW